MTPDVERRFWSKVQKTETCWLWTGSHRGDGYGRIKVRGKLQIAHRLVYEHLVAPIPEGLEIDHLCRVRRCVNPAHLEPVTRRENVLRGEGLAAKSARRNCCARGHAYDAENTAIRVMASRRHPCRRCRICTVEAQRRYRARKRAAA